MTGKQTTEYLDFSRFWKMKNGHVPVKYMIQATCCAPYGGGVKGRPRYRIENAVMNLIDLLYDGQDREFFTLRKVSRNTDIKMLFDEGLSFPELAAKFDISEQRVFQIMRGKRKQK